jgi:putative ABC transport system substrate-binding protein
MSADMLMSRRRLVGAAVVAIATHRASFPGAAKAQAPEKVRRVGFISMRSGPGEFDAAFRDALRGLGYVEGRNIQIDYGWAAESDRRAEELAARLVANHVEVIVAATTVAIRAAMRATTKIPIVMAAAADPVGSGLVASLSRPGGNVTGLSLISTDTGAKRLQLLREVVPDVSRVAVLLVERGSADDTAINARLVEQLQTAARQLGVALTFTTVRGGGEIAGAFATIQRDRARALFVPVNSLVIDQRARIVELAARHRLPTMYEVEGFVTAGGLLSYGPSLVDMYRRAAGYVDRILKGANPAELPLEQPTVFRLAINLKTAEALALPIAPALMARADTLIRP